MNAVSFPTARRHTLHAGTLVAFRHGQSEWNLENRFTGWTDVPLTEQGRRDAVLLAEALRDFRFDRAFASRLERSQETVRIILRTLGQEGIPMEVDSALNERHYGDLQGMNRVEIAAKYGAEQVRLWRRTYTARPPNGESIEDCEARTWRYMQHYVLPHAEAGKTVLVSAHGNSLRPIVMHFENMSGEEVAALTIDSCCPHIYTRRNGMMRTEVRRVPGVSVFEDHLTVPARR
ncbi:2,3-bisphosphoglycerate-dependent phosphoglycerate mutase [Candidatus Peregrinibacteria bacterium]|nr:2,3-bisphosphoglycerate-dependent phosphoglycerate mutase [Candidatus Peregrinibacteria bacterium]